MPDKVVFVSRAWVDAARAILEELVSRHGEPGREFSVCEIFSDAPTEVSPTGVAAWYFFIKGKDVTVGAGEVSNADVTIRADYWAILPTARLVYTPEILAERAKHPPEARSTTGDMSKAPPYLVELHNRLAVMTV